LTKKELPAVRKVQKALIDSTATVSDAASSIFTKIGVLLKNLDDDLRVSSTVSKKGEQVREVMSDIDRKYHVYEKATAVSQDAQRLLDEGKVLVEGVAEKTGINTATSAIKESFDVYVDDPVSAIAKKYELARRLGAIGRAVEDLYGEARSVIKPYFPPETPEELLRNAREELAYVSACIMQISPEEAKEIASQFGKLVVSKIAGVAAGGALLSLASIFGTAGTGAAIGGLSGAAATSASLAWVGGFVGGGMAAGAILTGGVSIVIGLGAYKMLGSERRAFESLDEVEQRIVQSCWMLITIIDDYLQNKDSKFDADSAYTILTNTLLPLQKLLIENNDGICQNLDTTNAGAYRQHVLTDFQHTVIDPFAEFTASGLAEKALHYDYVIGGVIYALLTQSAIDDSEESQLVLAALRRSDSDLANATEPEISNYLDHYDPEQLKGIANNVKGVYHELLWVEQYNAANETTQAELFGTSGHAGSDVRIVNTETGAVVDEYQLKATDDVAYVNEHIIKYPHVKVVVTDEAAAKMEDVQASDNRNADLQDQVEGDMGALEGNTIDDRVLEVAGLAATIATGQELLEMLHGKREFPEAVKEVVRKTGTTGAATAIAAYLFS